MNIDTTIYGYVYRAALYCPRCIVETLIDEGRAAPAAREMLTDDVIDAIAEGEALDNLERDDSDSLPQTLSAYSGLDPEDVCDRCSEVIYE